MRCGLIALLLIVMAGCQREHGTDAPAVPAPPPTAAPLADLHTSRDSLDWAGLYEGLLDCADCAGTHVQLTLENDGRFEMVTRRLIRGTSSSRSAGQFDWEAGGRSIVLTSMDSQPRFAVGEGRLLALTAGQLQPAWDQSGPMLLQSTSAGPGVGQSLANLLEDHQWTLMEATDATGQRMDALFPNPERAFQVNFTNSRVHVQGGCNGLRGDFRVDEEGFLTVRATMSTLMACEDRLMEADAALSALLADPLETVLVRGDHPRLVLLTTASDALVLRGELTPEARYGAPTLLFLEVDAHRVACADSPHNDGLCLNVRERRFDAQGLPVDSPSEWQAFAAEIQGYHHESGIRNVLRLKRFDPPAADREAPPQSFYVLDLVVESEILTE